jgi:hypothetical protein
MGQLSGRLLFINKALEMITKVTVVPVWPDKGIDISI